MGQKRIVLSRDVSAESLRPCKILARIVHEITCAARSKFLAKELASCARFPCGESRSDRALHQNTTFISVLHRTRYRNRVRMADLHLKGLGRASQVGPRRSGLAGPAALAFNE